MRSSDSTARLTFFIESIVTVICDSSLGSTAALVSFMLCARSEEAFTTAGIVDMIRPRSASVTPNGDVEVSLSLLFCSDRPRSSAGRTL